MGAAGQRSLGLRLWIVEGEDDKGETELVLRKLKGMEGKE